MGLSNAILSLASDQKYKTLGIATGQGSVLFIKLLLNTQGNTIYQEVPLVEKLSPNEWPAVSISNMEIGTKSYFVVAFLSGLIKIFRADTGVIVCELSAHSRQVCGLVCGKKNNKNVIATCSDDTFINLWEVSSNNDTWAVEIKLIESHRIVDTFLTGICFLGYNKGPLIASVYD